MAAQAASTAEWRDGLDRLVADLRATHPDPFGVIGEDRFEREVAALHARMPALSEPERMVAMMRLVGALGDGPRFFGPVVVLPAAARSLME